MCGANLVIYQPVFQCLTCYDESLVFCDKCWMKMKDLHKGHVIVMDLSNEGICDCGDCDVDNSLHCPDHSNLQSKCDKSPKAFYDSVWTGSKADFQQMLQGAYDLAKCMLEEYADHQTLAVLDGDENLRRVMRRLFKNRYFVRIFTIVLYFCHESSAPTQEEIDRLYEMQSNLEALYMLEIPDDPVIRPAIQQVEYHKRIDQCLRKYLI